MGFCLVGRQRESIRVGMCLLSIVFIFASFVHFLAPSVSAQPLIAVGIGPSALDVEPGDALTITVFFNNTGNATAPSAWINVSLPAGLIYVSDTSIVEGGIKTGDYNWTFTNVNTTNHNFDILTLVWEGLTDGESMTISADLEYLDQTSMPMPPSSTFATVTARRPVMSVTKITETGIIPTGGTFNYTIAFQNLGSVNASEVFINDSLPWEVTYLNDTASSVGGTQIGTWNWSFSNVAGFTSFDITVQALSNLSDGSIIVNRVNLYYRNANNIWFPIETATNSTMVAAPSMTFMKTVDKGLASAGDLLDYTLEVNNIGMGSARYAWINDTIPNGTTYDSSTPACDTIANNTCTWKLSDLAPGKIQVHLVVSVNASLPDSFVIQNDAYLNYTDSHGVPMGNLTSNASATVRESYLALVLEDRSMTSTPLDSIEFDVLIRSESNQSSLLAWLNITFPEEIQFISDNATDIGGIRTGDYRWEFNNITQGNYSFRITAEITSGTHDGMQLNVDFVLDHTDESGKAFPRATDRINVTIRAPVFLPGIVSDKGTYERSETSAITIFLNNTGSISALNVWVSLSVPTSVDYVNDTSASIGGSLIGALTYLFEDVDPGAHEFEVYFSFKELNEPTDIEVWVFLNYTDSNGDLIGESQQRTSFNVIIPTEEFPILPIVLVILLAIGISFAAAFSRESTKYSILMFFVPLFTRLRRREVLDHETRGMIRGYVIANPGDHFNSIKASLGLKNGTLAHHINILERENIIKSIKDGKFRRFFPIGMKVTDDAYPTKIERLILEIVKETPGITQKDIAKQLGMSQPTASYHLTKLKNSNAIRTEREGISVRHYLEESEE